MTNWDKNQIVSVTLTPELQTEARIKYVYRKKQEANVEILDPGISKQLGTTFQRVGFSQLQPQLPKVEQESPKQHMKLFKSPAEVKRVQPKDFPSLYLKQFADWVDSTFFPYRDPQSNKNNHRDERLQLKYYQRLIRDYLASPGSPYRGTLIFHGLGAGKTCTAIAVAEALKSDRNVIVMLPASLKVGFQRQLREDCGDPAYLTNTALMNRTYTFVSYNAPNTIAQLDAIGSLDHHTIIIDEVHNLISMMMNPRSAKGPMIYRRLFGAKDVKIVALSGTPVIQNPFEIALLMNLLRGGLITAIFKVEGSAFGHGQVEEGWLEVLQESLMNNPNWVHLNASPKQINAVYGGPHPDPMDPLFQDAVNEFTDKAREAGLAVKYMGIVSTQSDKNARIVGTPLFPDEEDLFTSLYLQTKIVGLEDLDLPFQVNTSQKKKKSKETITVNLLKDPTAFMRRIQGLVSFYPGGDPKSYPEITKIEFVTTPMSDYQFQQYEVVRDIERDRNRQRTIKRAQLGISKSASKKTRSQAEKDLGTSLFRTLSRQFSNFVFPPNIQRPLQAYWQDVLGKRLRGEEEDEEQEESSNETTTKTQENTKEVITAYFEQIQKALQELRDDPSQPLSKEHIGEFSPKMAAVLNNIENSPGSAIVYSFYKTLEGVGVFAKVLEANGWKRLTLPQASPGLKDPFARTKNIVDNFWLHTNKNINANKPGHVYALWSGESSDEERRAINMIFNDSRNKRGAYLRALLITKAAAEGVNLKNVRSVHILDPHWNETLMEQVIGRARRLGSHMDLPPEDRNVAVYRYLATLTPEQRGKHPDTLSTDEYLIQLAMTKHQTVEQLRQVLRRAAFDCRLWSARFREEGHEPENCFRPPPGSTGMYYLPDWREDLGYGKVVEQVKKTKETWKQILMDGNQQLYQLDVAKKQLIPLGSQDTKPRKLSEIPKPHKKLIGQIARGDVALPIAKPGEVPVLIGKVDQTTGQLIPTVAL